MNNKDLTLDEKVDKILTYTKRMYRAQLIKSVISLVLFLVLVVIPIVWLYYWTKSIDLTGYMEMLESLKGASGSVDKLNSMLNGIGS